MGIVSLFLMRDPNLKGRDFAIAAIIIGLIFILLQILLFVSIISIIYSVQGFISQDSGTLEDCLSKTGPGKDMCIMFSVTMHANETMGVSDNFCDQNVNDENIRAYCNAVIRNNSSYCKSISNSQNRINCYGLAAEANDQPSLEG